MRLRQFINLLEELSDNHNNDNLEIWNFESDAENETQVYDAKVDVESNGNKYIKVYSI